jgi:hypothetical protein
MTRLVASLLLSFALVFGAAAAQARPHHAMPTAAMQSDGHAMPMDGCMHGTPGHKSAPCPMLSCFPSVPFFLTPTKFGVPSPAAHGSAVGVLAADALVAGAAIETDPPVPRLFPI